MDFYDINTCSIIDNEPYTDLISDETKHNIYIMFYNICYILIQFKLFFLIKKLSCYKNIIKLKNHQMDLMEIIQIQAHLLINLVNMKRMKSLKKKKIQKIIKRS